MARRGHTKTRTGCVECKRRHLKCDETRPICRRCTFSARSCVYRTHGGSTGTASRHQASQTIISSASPADPGSPFHSVGDGSASLLRPHALVHSLGPSANVDHVELFHHFTTEVYKTILVEDNHTELYHRAVVERALVSSFLLDEVLAVSACHMSLKRPDRAAYYCDLAAKLQASALTGYWDTLEKIDSTNCLDIFLFSHLLALCIFWETFSLPGSDLSTLLERLIGCIRLLRGINVVLNSWFDCLVQTALGPIIIQSQKRAASEKPSQDECRGLREMLDQADLSPSSIQTCQASLDSLQTSLDYENAVNFPSASTHQAFSWLITTTEDFTNLLDLRRPEALIILAHYATLLHRRRGSWVIGNAGHQVLFHIQGYLGKRWDRWLALPYEVITGEAPQPSQDSCASSTVTNS
ncbi:hypothetical protein GGS24DRAFT_167512 [Hypoxylon argillaceum]|nr:hypothetical protein GGS24DRAFT_167512 [Hypoxylon argillaceum]KAI1147589.1 hypothetical protein F4825DRAFT_136146 [Nemania diffusa]